MHLWYEGPILHSLTWNRALGGCHHSYVPFHVLTYLPAIKKMRFRQLILISYVPFLCSSFNPSLSHWLSECTFDYANPPKKASQSQSEIVDPFVMSTVISLPRPPKDVRNIEWSICYDGDGELCPRARKKVDPSYTPHQVRGGERGRDCVTETFRPVPVQIYEKSCYFIFWLM